MASLIPFNRRRNMLSTPGHEDLYHVLDDFFSDSFWPTRNLMRDTFKIDVKEGEKEYLIEAELPGTKKDEIELNLNDGCLTISVKREENVNEEGKNFVHRERRLNSMSRSIGLADANPGEVKAALENGILSITVAKQEKTENNYRINID